MAGSKKSRCVLKQAGAKISVSFRPGSIDWSFLMRQPTADLRIRSARPLLSPAILEEDLPLTESGATLVDAGPAVHRRHPAWSRPAAAGDRRPLLELFCNALFHPDD